LFWSLSFIMALTLIFYKREFVSNLQSIYRLPIQIKMHSNGKEENKSLIWQDSEYDPSKGNLTDTVCLEWGINTDMWWTHNVEWAQAFENDTHYCYQRMHNQEKAEFFRNLYDVQFKKNCSHMTTKSMWSSGWGANFLNVQDGLLHAAIESYQPMQFYNVDGSWNYAGKKDGSKPVCPEKSLDCYFLKLSRCKPKPENVTNALIYKAEGGGGMYIRDKLGGWAYEYATRPQAWLRRSVYNYTQSLSLTAPCTVIHVRRSDVVTDMVSQRRKYHAIKEYMKLGGKDITENILLLTDDQNAVTEALSQYPDYNWIHFNRPRYRGAEGGWESHVPSDDPKHEVITILSTLQLVRQCNLFIHSESAFADYIRKDTEYYHNSKSLNIDDGTHPYNPKNAKSVKLSKSEWM
jgi:hypothetical protein